MSYDWFNELANSSATRLGDLVAAREIGVVELLDAYLYRLEAYDGALRTHAFVDYEGARAAAVVADRELGQGRRRSRLHGVPVSHKDNILTAGVPTRINSRTSFARTPTTDATVVARLRQAGMVLLGKTNTTEFACGDQLVDGDTPNPWNVVEYTGASSAGSASAIAAGLAAAATGSDTGGSIRAPAAMCGIVGVKPTYGRVSRYGLVPLAWSMDHIGPMTRTVEDAAVMLAAMAGQDPLDRSSAATPVPQDLAVLPDGLKGMRIGVPRGHFATGLTPAVSLAFEAALEVMTDLGANLEEVFLPSAGSLGAVGGLLSMWEGFTLHASHLRREAQAYGPKARAQLSSGGFFGSDEVGQALQIRFAFSQEVEHAFRDVDVIVTPTLPFSSVTRESWIVSPPDTSWATRAFSLTGHPAMTVPCGFDERGLPIGLQIAAKHFDERTMFTVAHNYEGATPWHLRLPDSQWWGVPVERCDAVYKAPTMPMAEQEALRAVCDRLRIDLNDDDLERVGGIVGRVRNGLEALRLHHSSGVEPFASPYIPELPTPAVS